MTDNELLAELLKSSERTNELLQRHLFRLRFSLGFLFVLTTLVCIGLVLIATAPIWVNALFSSPTAIPATPSTATPAPTTFQGTDPRAIVREMERLRTE